MHHIYQTEAECHLCWGPHLSLNSTKPFRIEADSSNFTIGTVLSQVSPEDKKWHLVTFLSKSLSC